MPGLSAPLSVLACLLALLAPQAAAREAKPPRIKHLFVVVLENRDAKTTFGPGSAAPYLARTLRRAGAFLPNYFGIGHHSLANYIALISGQPPNPATAADCPVYVPMRVTGFLSDGVVSGEGCVYPRRTQTIAGQLRRHGRDLSISFTGRNELQLDISNNAYRLLKAVLLSRNTKHQQP